VIVSDGRAAESGIHPSGFVERWRVPVSGDVERWSLPRRWLSVELCRSACLLSVRRRSIEVIRPVAIRRDAPPPAAACAAPVSGVPMPLVHFPLLAAIARPQRRCAAVSPVRLDWLGTERLPRLAF